jgi:uncharacterized membrane protein YjfL (UPF0719 family)
MDVLIGIVPVVLTLLVFSRLIGDNPVFRAVQYLFVGVSLGYAFVIIYFQVLRPNTIAIISGTNAVASIFQAVPYILGLLLLTRIAARQSSSWLANIPLALLFGVATALALGGAIVGTLVPQILDTVAINSTDPFQVVSGLFLALGVILTLSYFYYTAPQQGSGGRLLKTSALVGRWLLIIAFGSFFAGAVLTYLTALNERFAFIIGWFRSLLG